jgi:hypothetical protein
MTMDLLDGDLNGHLTCENHANKRTPQFVRSGHVVRV